MASGSSGLNISTMSDSASHKTSSVEEQVGEDNVAFSLGPSSSEAAVLEAGLEATHALPTLIGQGDRDAVPQKELTVFGRPEQREVNVSPVAVVGVDVVIWINW